MQGNGTGVYTLWYELLMRPAHLPLSRAVSPLRCSLVRILQGSTYRMPRACDCAYDSIGSFCLCISQSQGV
eukprot:24781-Eustigmatos_ZCMA.PRE.1